MERLLIANRGEIALRIQRACREQAIETVAAYTRVDSRLLHLSLADRTVCIGESSYMDGQQLLAAATTHGCDAVHPGYGLLSEDAAFAGLVESNQMTFVGPTPDQIALMGDKASARRYLAQKGVPVLPGSDDKVDNGIAATALAREIGYPLLLKASHGGGGRGIAVVEDPGELESTLVRVMAEAEALFGSSDVYLEKYLPDARHIELQVFGDGRGKVVHLGARECSIQRRHQKLLEEAPPPGIEPEAIDELALTCCRALSELQYRNAGTLEFLYSDGAFYFIEMNTRIQVEHPVTEAVTHLDLVKMQLQISSTGRLPIEQSDVKWSGHAIECRINAEDEKFMPSPGTVESFQSPGGFGVRFDSHLYTGYVVPHQYDSLAGKLVVFGLDREEAMMRMQRALAELKIRPIATNINLHRRILADECFRAGDLSTRFLERY